MSSFHTRVKFNPVVKVYELRVWSFAYNQARKSSWEQCARDNERFHLRIEEVGRQIAWVLTKAHRQKILDKRVCVDEQQ